MLGHSQGIEVGGHAIIVSTSVVQPASQNLLQDAYTHMRRHNSHSRS
jgi:hypothetical protein